MRSTYGTTDPCHCSRVQYTYLGHAAASGTSSQFDLRRPQQRIQSSLIASRTEPTALPARSHLTCLPICHNSSLLPICSSNLLNLEDQPLGCAVGFEVTLSCEPDPAPGLRHNLYDSTILFCQSLDNRSQTLKDPSGGWRVLRLPSSCEPPTPLPNPPIIEPLASLRIARCTVSVALAAIRLVVTQAI
jgi:hypothetical protein